LHGEAASPLIAGQQVRHKARNGSMLMDVQDPNSPVAIHSAEELGIRIRASEPRMP
jgi:hypothetical protein